MSQRLVHRLRVELGLGAKPRTMLRVALAAAGLEQSTTPGLDDAKALRYEDAGGLANSNTSLHHIPQPILMFGGGGESSTLTFDHIS